MKPITRCPAATQKEFTPRPGGRNRSGWFPVRFIPPLSDLRRRSFGGGFWSSSANWQPGPAVAQVPHCLAHAHSQFRDVLDALEGLRRQVQLSPAYFQEQQLRIAKNSRQRI